MEQKSSISAIIICVGIVAAGLLIGSGLKRIAFKDRAVTVKGLATRDVQADYVVWPLHFEVEGNDLANLQNQATNISNTVIAFLKKKGFEADDIRTGKVSVNDQWANYYTQQRPANHYQLQTSVVVSTNKVDLVVENQNGITELLEKGIILDVHEWEMDFQYNSLTSIKPEMIEEATRNAHVVAQKFADDADCRLGSIRRASQGQFSIDGDQYQPWIKHIRVVTTVDYYLR